MVMVTVAVALMLATKAKPIGNPSQHAGSQIFREGLELADRRLGVHLVEAVLEVIVDQFALGVGDSFFDGVELLGEVDARAPFGEHREDARQMAVRPLQASDDLGVGSVFHESLLILPPRIG